MNRDLPDERPDGREISAVVRLPDDPGQSGQILAAGAGVFRVRLRWYMLILPVALVIFGLLALTAARRRCKQR